MGGHLRRDPCVVRFPGNVGDDELDDGAEEARSLLRSQAVGVDDRCQLPGPLSGRRKALELGDDIVVQLGVQPAQLGQLDERVDRPGELPVDEPDRHTITGHDVPRRDVAVAYDAAGAAEFAPLPGEPDRPRGPPERTWWPLPHHWYLRNRYEPRR